MNVVWCLLFEWKFQDDLLVYTLVNFCEFCLFAFSFIPQFHLRSRNMNYVELLQWLHIFILPTWDHEEVWHDWRNASIVPLFKKGSRRECGNHMGIFLLSIAGKMLSLGCWTQYIYYTSCLLLSQNPSVISEVVEAPLTWYSAFVRFKKSA